MPAAMSAAPGEEPRHPLAPGPWEKRPSTPDIHLSLRHFDAGAFSSTAINAVGKLGLARDFASRSRVFPMDPETEESLMAAYVAGDRGAFARLFARVAPRVHAFFGRAFRDE